MFELLCPIKKHSVQSPKSIALIDEDVSYTYKQLDQKVDDICQLLGRKGIQTRQRVAFIADTSYHTIVLLFALARLQATACPLSFRLPKEEIPSKVKLLQATHFIETKTFSATQLPLHEEMPHLEKNPLFALLFTSGTGGEPKIAALSFENFYYSALGSNLRLSLKPRHKWLLSLPLFHVAGLAVLFRCFMSESAVVLSSQSLEESIFRHKISHVSLVPTQLYRLIQSDGCAAQTSSIECALVGGAPISFELFKRAKEKGMKIFPTYGMTEMSSQITQYVEEEGIVQLNAGEPLPFREVKIAPDGEILVKGKTLFQGYVSTEGITMPKKDGWFATSDIGCWEGSKLQVIGRKDLMFISGGENIQPGHIEKLLYKMPGILQAFVIPVDDPEYGQRPFAFLQCEGDCIKKEKVAEFLQDKLPKYAIPFKIAPLPDSPEIKTSRSQLKQLAEAYLQEGAV